MSAVPSILVPLAITDAMVTSSTLAEPSASETAWVSAGTYVVGDRRIRVATHREYECLVNHTGIATLPEDDPTRWLDIGPTDYWAMFDSACSTQTATVTSLTVVVQPGFFNAMAFYNLTGASIAVTVKDAPAGNTIYSYSGALDGPYLDEFDYCWGPFRENSKLFIQGITPYPEAEITVVVTASTGVAVGIGMMVIGDLRPLILDDTFGGTQAGAKAEPVDYSYISTNAFGDTTIVRRRSATDMRISIVLPQSDADYALGSVQEVLATPVAVIATDAAGYAGLNVFGLVTGSLSYDSAAVATLELNVKGLV